jgi:hypothetical protein
MVIPEAAADFDENAQIYHSKSHYRNIAKYWLRRRH